MTKGGAAIVSARVDFVVGEARADQTTAVLALLPELLDAVAWPTRFLVAHLPGQPSALLGAAAFAPVIHRARTSGFRGQCRVLPAYRRQGIGRALVARLAAEVAAWDVAHLLSWQAEAEGPAASFMRAMGFRVNFGMHHFIGDYVTMKPLCARMTKALRRHGRVPPGFELLPLAQVPLAPVLALHCDEFDAAPAAAAAAIESALADPLMNRLSIALWDGRQLAGYVLAGPGEDMPELRFWASHPAHRDGWAAMLLLEGYTDRFLECGLPQSRFACNDRNLAPLNIARKIGARLESVRSGHVLDLAGFDAACFALARPDPADPALARRGPAGNGLGAPA
ncbi:hypothetical protein BH11PSE9_BH11PSE9_32960 [soil metagenome]